MTRRAAARLAAVLFVVTAALFVAGVSAERSDTEHPEPSAHREAEEGHDEAGEHRKSESGHDETDETETVLGLDLESPVLVTAAVLVSLLLAAGLWSSGHRGVAIAAVVFGAAFAVLDLTEARHQADESRTGLVVLALALAAGHLVAAGAAAWSTRPPGPTTI